MKKLVSILFLSSYCVTVAIAQIGSHKVIQHEYVDLGLSVKWATCNVGAGKPEDYGDYYSWGETKTKDLYNLSTYKYCKGTIYTYTKYCGISRYGNDGYTDNNTTLDAEDDVAHVKWGGNWRTPTKDEFQELTDNCIWSWTTLNGVNGIKFRSKKPGFTDCYIFLPSAGFKRGSELKNTGKSSSYLSRSLNIEYPYLAWRLYFQSDSRKILDDGYRTYGYSIRPVCP